MAYINRWGNDLIEQPLLRLVLCKNRNIEMDKC